MQVAFRTTRRPGRCRSSSTSCARSSTTCARPARRPDRAERQRRIRRRRFHPLHADRRRRRLRAAEARGGGACARSCSRCANVTKVNLYGVQDEKIFVEFSHAKLATLGISPQAIFDSLAKQNAVVPAGIVETGAQRVPLRVTGALDGAKAVAETPVEAGGARLPPRRHRDGDARLRGSLRLPRAPARQAGARHRRRHGEGRATSSTLGDDVEDGDRRSSSHGVPQGIDIEQIADQPKVVDACDRRVRADPSLEALGIVLLVSFLSLGWRTGIVVALSVPLVLAIIFICHERPRHRPAPHHARRADHRARPARRRRHHRRRDDGGEDGAGLGPPARRVLRLDLDRLSDAHRHAGHGGRLPADRLRQFRGRRICRRHLLGRRHRADRVVVRGGGVHALSRRQASARFPQGRHAHPDPHAIYETRLYRALRRVIAWCVDHRSRDGRGDGRRLRRRRSSPSAACSSSSSRCRSGPSCSSRCACPRAPSIGVTTRDRAQGRGDARARTRTSPPTRPISARARRASGSASIRNCRTRPSPRSSSSSKDVEARERIKARLEKAVADGRLAGGARARRPLQFRAAGRLPGAVPRRRPGSDGGARASPTRCARSCARTQNVVDPHLDWNEQTPSIRLDVDQERARALGLTPQDVAADAADADLRRTRHRRARRHREGRGGGARGSARSALDLGRIGDLTISARERPRGAAVAGRARSATTPRSRSCGGATATCRSPCAPTSSTACSRRT